MLGGLGFPFINELNTALLLIILLIFLTAAIGTFFLRETKFENELKNLYSDIFPEDYKHVESPEKNDKFADNNDEENESRVAGG